MAFDGDFEALEKPTSYASLIDDPQPSVSFLASPTKICECVIQKALRRLFIPTDASRSSGLRVIVSRRLGEIKYLDEEDMLIAWLDCFFCGYFCALASYRGTHTMAGHWALWDKGIEHGDISVGNIMCDPVTKRGVLNDFDLAREGRPNRKPSAKDNIGTLPFLALDLLNEQAFNGLVQCRYRHDAESFTWSLIYICICMARNDEGRIGTINPHPLSPWFMTMENSFYSKMMLSSDRLLRELPLHQRCEHLIIALYGHWIDRW